MELKAAAASDDELIRDGSDATFMADVIEASAEVPVIVDFWAPWCGPCKTLTPALEQAVREARGKVRLVKVDVDQNQMIAAQLRVQSIPTVYAFVNGQPVDAFQGALPGSQIKQFIERLIAMSGGDAGLTEALDQADAMLAEGAAADAAQVYSAVLGEEQENTRAIAGLARCYLALDDVEKARATLALVPQEKAGDPVIASVEAQIALADEAAGAGDASDLRARVERNPDDHQARYQLGVRLLLDGDAPSALDAFLELMRRDRKYGDDLGRRALIQAFDLVEDTDLVAQVRRRMSSLLF